MYSLYYNRSTPFFAFLEGLVRMFDWSALLELRKSRSVKQDDDNQTPEDDEWSDRIVDWYIRDSIATFEREESRNLAGVPVPYRRAAAVADIVLGPLPVEDVILCYESIVPGACDRIMHRASANLKGDGEEQVQLLKERARQGYIGMGVGFILTMLLSCSAMYLCLSGHLAAGLSIAGIFVGLVAAASGYVSKAQLRRKYYTRDFFSRSALQR